MESKIISEFNTIIKAPVEKVWQALTDPEKVKQYFFGTKLETDWKVGNPVHFRGEWQGKEYMDKGIVKEYTPNKSLTYSYLSSWSGLPDKPENYLEITYKVKKVDDGTKLTIIQSNYDEQRAKDSENNWKTVIDGLKKLVEEKIHVP